MTSEVGGEEEASPRLSLEEYLRPDPSLAFLQGMANSTGIGMPVALSVAGCAVVGSMVSGRYFFEEQARRMREGTTGDPETDDDNFRQNVGVIADAVENMGSAYRDLRQPYEESDDDSRPVAFVHLNNAMVDGVEIGWWRGKISSVDGWTILSST